MVLFVKKMSERHYVGRSTLEMGVDSAEILVLILEQVVYLMS